MWDGRSLDGRLGKDIMKDVRDLELRRQRKKKEGQRGKSMGNWKNKRRCKAGGEARISATELVLALTGNSLRYLMLLAMMLEFILPCPTIHIYGTGFIDKSHGLV